MLPAGKGGEPIFKILQLRKSLRWAGKPWQEKVPLVSDLKDFFLFFFTKNFIAGHKARSPSPSRTPRGI
jgi:hypothetical protein